MGYIQYFLDVISGYVWVFLNIYGVFMGYLLCMGIYFVFLGYFGGGIFGVFNEFLKYFLAFLLVIFGFFLRCFFDVFL